MARKCIERCPECRFKDDDSILPVADDIPYDAEVLYILEQPGRFESNIGRPLVGPAGKEADGLYFPLAGVSRYEVGVANTVKCKYADSGEAPPASVISSCSEFHLRRTIEQMNPRVIVLCGGVANSLLSLNIDMVHGTGRRAKLWDWEGPVFSLYHFALGLHKSSAMQALIDDCKALRGFLRGEPGLPVDKYPNPSYYRLRTPDDVSDILSGYEKEEPLALDTESSKSWDGYRSTIRYTPWCATFCISPGEAFMVKVSDKLAMTRLGMFIQTYRTLVFHNLAYDWDILHRIGIDSPWERCYDTMALSFHDARLPKGLKALSYRLLGATMRNFDDVVTPYGKKAALEYFGRVSGIDDWPKPVQEPTGGTTTKKCKACKGSGIVGVGRGKLRKYSECNDCGSTGQVTEVKMSRKQSIKQKVDRLLLDCGKNPDIDLWERWCNWESTQLKPVIARLGPPPLASVDLVPEQEILAYAGSDAESTRRIFPILRHRLMELRRSFRR